VLFAHFCAMHVAAALGANWLCPTGRTSDGSAVGGGDAGLLAHPASAMTKVTKVNEAIFKI
jgi:hypothetical protein